jgi:hypothetical protein
MRHANSESHILALDKWKHGDVGVVPALVDDIAAASESKTGDQGFWGAMFWKTRTF